MSNVKIIFSKSFGQLIAEVTENADGSLTLSNPCMIQIGNDQLALMPVLGTVNETTLEIQDGEYNKQFFTPKGDIYNYYQSQFGSGIQLTTAPNDGKIIL